MAAPVWDSIELDAVREAHFVLLVEPPALRGSFLCGAALSGTVGVTVTVTTTTTDSRTLRGNLEVLSLGVAVDGGF